MTWVDRIEISGSDDYCFHFKSLKLKIFYSHSSIFSNIYSFQWFSINSIILSSSTKFSISCITSLKSVLFTFSFNLFFKSSKSLTHGIQSMFGWIFFCRYRNKS